MYVYGQVTLKIYSEVIEKIKQMAIVVSQK